ncbi:MAG: hypothetical protein KKF62_07295 [Bacteroidetes bacterium]|nr:hypothetical protein [Bacteroidota bacterium]MBU1116471.1 hypothetical protein [Bacteroidota bacterium]MBU1797294.1 hypothetical protein [Bacteroidota bacterium]
MTQITNKHISKVLLISILSLLFYFNIFGQNKGGLEELKTQFESFNYSNVISIASILLQDKEQFSEDEIIEIYLVKGISHYSLDQSELVKDCFFEILNLNKNYKINASKVSPKIINEFEKLKIEYGRFITNNESLITVKTDTLYHTDTLYIKESREIYSELIVRSLAFPGWGHLYSGDKTKGWILTSATALSLSSMLYFIFDAENKHSQYLNEVDPLLIEKKYNDYNTSYKIRNTLIATYAIIWIYTQIDILFLSDIPFVPEIGSANVNNAPYYLAPDIQLSFHLQF